VISTPALLGVTGLVLATLGLIFPRDELISSLRERRPHAEDELGAQYGKAVIQSVPAPRDDVLRIVVAERQFSLAELPEARRTLAPLRDSADAQARRDGGLLEHRVLRLMIENAEESRTPREQSVEELKQLLERLSHETWDPPTALAFAREAVGHGQYAAASRFYASVIAAGPVRPEILEEAIRHEIGQGRYAIAADYYFGAMARAESLAERRRLFRRGIETLVSGNTPDAALTAADRHAGELMQDEPTLQLLLATALAADAKGRAHASRYYRALMDVGGLRPDILEAAVRHALALGQYTVAAEYYFIARQRSPIAADRRRFFQRGLETLQSGNLLAEAFDAADRHLADLADDEPTLRYLVQFALRANDQRRAQDYSRRLIRISGLDLPRRLLAIVLDAIVRPAHAQPAVTARPYNEESYRLAYDVFIANGNFDDAKRVAEAALAQRPDDDAWRMRLIQLAEWSNDIAEALRHWKVIAARRPTREAYEAILRLAPGVGDDEAHLEAWRFIAGTRPLTRDELNLVVELHENVGRPADAVAWLRELDRRAPRADHLELIAWVEDRAGRPEAAIAAWTELEKRHGLTVDHAITIASLHFSRANFPDAFAVLDRARARVGNDTGEQAVAFWSLYGDLAWRLGNDEAAARAYERLSAAGRLEPFEFVRLIRILRQTHPEEAARLAEAAWLERRDPELFMVAAEILAARRDRRGLERLFASIRPQDEILFAGNAYFYTTRSRFLLERGFTREAVLEWRRALAIRPNDVDLRTGLLFLLIETRSTDDLRIALSAWRAASITERAYWPAYAASYQTLGEPRRALPYYRLALPDRSDDYLWLLGFADALEDAAEGGMAWRVRRHAWHTIRARRAKDANLLAVPEELMGYARLTTRFAPGDRDLAVMRHVMRQGLLSSPNPGVEATAREMVLAWAIATDRPGPAKAWLWQQYGRRLARPAYAEIAIALQENDYEAMERLLARQADTLPRYDRQEATRAVRMPRLGQTLGWASQENYPADDDVHGRLEQDLRRTSTSLILDTAWARFGPLRYREHGAALSYWLTPDVRLVPGLRLRDQRVASDTDLVNVPRLDRTTSLLAEVHTRRTVTGLTLGQRSALTEFSTAHLSHQHRFGTRLGATLDLGRNQFAPETAALRVGGLKDEARLAFTWDFSRREYVTLGTVANRYMTQSRTLAGIGRRIEAETGYRIRTDYPNLTARLYAGHTWFSTTASTDSLAARINPGGGIPPGSFFVPDAFTYYSAAIGFGEFLRRDYSRGIRPFADVSIGHNTVTGAGYGIIAGFGGSVFGSDHLSLAWTRSRGGSGVNLTFEELALRYQIHF